MTTRSAVPVPAKPLLTDSRYRCRVFHRNASAPGGWDAEFRSEPPPGMPVVYDMGQLDLSSGLYDAKGVCVVLG